MSKLTNLIAALALGAFGIGGAGLGLYELSRETAAARPPVLFVFDTSEDGQAKAAVNLALKTQDYAKAKQLDRSALSISAYNTYARLRLAYIDVKEHGTLTAAGERELACPMTSRPMIPLRRLGGFGLPLTTGATCPRPPEMLCTPKPSPL